MRWHFVWEKGLYLKTFLGGPILIIEIQYIPIQFVLELHEPPEIINRDSIHSYSVCTTAPRVPIILLIWRPPFLILAGGGGGGILNGPSD